MDRILTYKAGMDVPHAVPGKLSQKVHCFILGNGEQAYSCWSPFRGGPER